MAVTPHPLDYFQVSIAVAIKYTRNKLDTESINSATPDDAIN